MKRDARRADVPRHLVVMSGACLLGLALGVSPADAQSAGDTEGRFHLGPVALTPTISLTNIGVDTNVFNESGEPQRDFTAVVTPALEAKTRLGRVRLAGTTALSYNYFKDNKDQRSFGRQHSARVDLLLNRVTPHVSAAYGDVRRRPNSEIDARVRQFTTGGTAGFDVLLSGKTTLTLDAGRTRTNYEDVVVLGESIQQALNGYTDTATVSLRQAVTPLTTFVVAADTIRNRFEFEPLRNANSVRLLPGVEFKPFALINGSAFVGFRHFSALGAGVPDFSGLVANAGVSTTVRRFRLGLRVGRDVTYSVQAERPYYLDTSVGGTVTFKLTIKWDVTGGVSRELLSYRSIEAADVIAPQEDTILDYSMGFGYQIARTLRVGLLADYVTRESNVFDTRNFDGWRIGGLMNYGF